MQSVLKSRPVLFIFAVTHTPSHSWRKINKIKDTCFQTNTNIKLCSSCGYRATEAIWNVHVALKNLVKTYLTSKITKMILKVSTVNLFSMIPLNKAI